MTGNIKRSCIVGAIAVSVAFAAYDGWLSARALSPDAWLFTEHRWIVAILVATWLVADMQESRRGYQASFDHGWFVLSFFFVYVPYYLFATRRRRGLLILAGVGVLFLLPQLAELVVWSVS